MTDDISPESAQRSLREHVQAKATEARQRYGNSIDRDAILRLLADPAFVRYRVAVQFDAETLGPGEFAWLESMGDHPSDGFRLHLHPFVAPMDRILPLLIAYYVPSINYGDVVSPAEAELFGATLLGIPVEEYYATLCKISDALMR